MWFLVALAGYAVNAVVNVLDKFVLDKRVKSPLVFAFYSTIVALLFFLLIPWVGFLRGPSDYLVALLGGAAFVGGLWAGYVGIKKSEVSHIGPLSGAVIPVFTLIWSGWFFSEQFSGTELIAIALLVIGSLAISIEKSQKHNGFHMGLFWGIVGGFLWSIYGVASKYLYMGNNFSAGFVWSQGFIGICAAFLLVFPPVWRSFAGSNKPSEKMNGKQLTLVAFDKFLGFVGLVLVQFAVALGSVTIVYALAGIQYALLIIIVFVLSKFRSRFCFEEYGRGELAQEFFAIMLIAAGLALLI